MNVIVSKGLLVENILSIIKARESVTERVQLLDKAIKRILEIDNSIEELEDLILIEKPINRALEIEEEIKAIGLERFSNLITELNTNNSKQKLRQEFYDECEDLFHENMKVCPLCETILEK